MSRGPRGPRRLVGGRPGEKLSPVAEAPAGPASLRSFVFIRSGLWLVPRPPGDQQLTRDM